MKLTHIEYKKFKEDLMHLKAEIKKELCKNDTAYKIEIKATELRKEFGETIQKNAVAIAELTTQVSLLCKIVVGAIIAAIGSLGTTILMAVLNKWR